jgi:hypothetical protein
MVEKPYSEYTNKELKEEYIGLYDIIYNVECYGTSDLLRYNQVAHELIKRGIVISTKPHFST